MKQNSFKTALKSRKTALKYTQIAWILYVLQHTIHCELPCFDLAQISIVSIQKFTEFM